MQASLGYLSTLEDSIHWFCNDETRLVVVEALSLFSFPDGDALQWLQNNIKKVLSRCYQCAEKYQTCAKKETQNVTRELYGYSTNNVDSYLAKIKSWDEGRLSAVFQDTLKRCETQNVRLADQSGPGFEAATLCGLFECLWCPALCEEPLLLKHFYTVFTGIQEGGKLLRVAGSILPAMFTFAFSSDRRLKDWSRKCFEKAKIQISASQFATSGKHELIKICENLRDGQMHPNSFWNGLQCILRYTDPTAIFNTVRDAEMSIMDFVCGEISSHTSNMASVIQSLNILLPALGLQIWSACPIPAQELGAKIIGNTKFVDNLAHPESLVPFSTAVKPLTEYLYWTRPYILAQYGGNKYRAARQILKFLFSQDLQKFCPAVSQLHCRLQGLKIILALLRDLSRIDDKANMRSFRIELRGIIDDFASIIGETAFPSQAKDQASSDVAQVAADILISTVQVDCDVFWDDFVALSTTEVWAQGDSKYSAPSPGKIWSIFFSNTGVTNLPTLQRFMEVIGRQIPLIDTIEITGKMTKELKLSIEVFNKAINNAFGTSNAVLRNMSGLWSAAQVRNLLSRAQTNEGIIALMFSPNRETYQEILNLLKEAYEAPGRIEAFRNSFMSNFDSTVSALIHVINSWSVEGIFKSAVRIVRTSTNLVDILFHETNGLVSTVQIRQMNEAQLEKLWHALWRMLETAYRMALPWADKFDKEDLIEFMRDVLECSELLLSRIGAFHRVIQSSRTSQTAQIATDEKRLLKSTLLNDCLKAVKSLTTWLRLNNEDLLQSCVNFVCRLLGTLAKAGIMIDDDTVYILDRVIVNSKKRKNCLTSGQRTEIYIALCEHTENAEDPQLIPDPSRVPGAQTAASVSNAPKGPIQIAVSRQAVSDCARNADVPKRSTTPSVLVPVAEKKMTPAERAEFLRKRSGALPLALQSKRPVIRNASAGAVRKEESSESDSGSDEDIEGLFSSNDVKSPVIRRVEKRQTQKFDVTTPIFRPDPRIEKNRVAQNIRARTNPDLKELHLRILSWDPAHDGELPPDTNKAEYSKLINSYQTADRYRKAIEPLFLLETWQHIVSSRTDIKEADRFEIILQTRSAVDNFVDLLVTVSLDDWKKQLLSDPDLLMLSTTTDFRPGYGSIRETCLAKVQGVMKKKDLVEIGLRTVPSAGMVKHLRPTVQLFCVKLSGLTPIHREFATIKALPYYDLCDEIVTGRPTKGMANDQRDIEKLMKAYGVNEPQAKAIDAALSNMGFTLIQGPPGTGKTKTILGMVGAFLSASRTQGTAISIPGQRELNKKDETKKKKILLCAPSNAAVDEIVLRLKHGILTEKGEKYIPKIVRMGMSDAINVNVQDVTLDALLDDMLNKADDKLKGRYANDPTELREKLNAALKERDAQRALLETARNENRDTQIIESEIKRLNLLKATLGEQLDDLRDKQSQRARAKDIERKKFQTQILADADVICATLSGSGHDLMASVAVDFETVIIDEACQTTELSALIPLKYGCTRCIMVGDPNQLPPTVLSTEAVNFAYNESLFVRMQRNSPSAVRLLAIQYRMHSSISRFPSKHFYEGKLLDGPDVDVQTRRPWHKSTLFNTYRFFDIRGREEESGKHSVYNMAEAKAALAIVRRLQEDFFDVDFDGRIGIVTPYKEQHFQIRRLFQREFGQSIISTIDFNTVDGFQGQEKDIIIFSCVRANEIRGIGFLSDVRRMNVALTRAKSSIFILGHGPALKSNTTWRALLEDAQARDMYTPVKHDTFAKKTRLIERSPKAKHERKRESSPSAEKKEVMKKVKRDVDAQVKPKSTIFETFKRPEAPSSIKKEVVPKITSTSNGVTDSTKIQSSNENGSISARPELNGSNGSGTAKAEQTTTDPAALAIKVAEESEIFQNIAAHQAKKKAEPSLFIKRKKPAK